MRIHFEPLPAGLEHYLVRAWREDQCGAFPSGQSRIEPVTGQPWADYQACAVLSVHDRAGQRRAEIKGIVDLPAFAFPLFRSIAPPLLGLSEIFGERWEQDPITGLYGKRVVVIPVQSAARLSDRSPQTTSSTEGVAA